MWEDPVSRIARIRPAIRSDRRRDGGGGASVEALRLEIVEGPQAGLRVPLEGPVEIGRDGGCVLVLQDDLASRHHARAWPTTEGALVEDLGSLNGTFLNGNQIHEPAKLKPADHLLIGTTVLEVRSAEQIAVRPSAVRPIPPALAVPQ